MPMLGIGGMQLYRAETPGPMKDNKLAPRITESAKALWYIYLGLTIACCIAYAIAGMSWFDALGHAFSTIAIGGFSTHDTSIGYFDSVAIETVAVFFMLLASANFSLHFLLIIAGLINSLVYPDTSSAIRYGIFHLVSIVTTTGYTSTGFAWWPGAMPILLILLSFMGGCAGSTAGGIKVMRIQLMYKQGHKEIVRLIHPNAVLSIKSNGQVINPNIMAAVTAFFSMYIFSFAIIGFLLTVAGLDWVTAFSAAAACLNNLGPGLGEVANSYASINDAAKWILSFAMLLGRLELFTLLVLFTVTFWRD